MGGVVAEKVGPSGVPEPVSNGLWARLRSSGVGSWLQATTVGTALFSAVDAAAARTAIGAETAGAASAVQANLTAHTGNTSNPHSVTAAQVGADPAGTAVTAVTNHNIDTTSVHGIADTSALETTSGSQSKADAAQAAAIADAATKYYNQSSFSAAPTAAEPLKANGAGNVTLATHLYLGDSTMYFSKSGTNIIAKTPNGLYFRDSNNYDRIFFSTVTTRFRSPNNAKYINVTNIGLGVNVESPGGLLHVQGAGGAEVAMILQAGAAPTANALEMRDSGGTVQASFAKNFAWTPPQLADSAAANGTVYYSTDAAKLVFKDLAGIVNALY